MRNGPLIIANGGPRRQELRRTAESRACCDRSHPRRRDGRPLRYHRAARRPSRRSIPGDGGPRGRASPSVAAEHPPGSIDLRYRLLIVRRPGAGDISAGLRLGVGVVLLRPALLRRGRPGVQNVRRRDGFASGDPHRQEREKTTPSGLRHGRLLGQPSDHRSAVGEKETGTFCAKHPKGGHQPKVGRGKMRLFPFPAVADYRPHYRAGPDE
jgi:hypothetical protein